MNPMLADDWDPEKLKFPVILQPKIDGVRGWNPAGKMLARSMNPHENLYTTNFYSSSIFAGLDGELAAEHHCHPRLCSLTASALSTISGEPYTVWWVFDIIRKETVNLVYEDRLAFLEGYVASMQVLDARAGHLRVMPHWLCTSIDQVMEKHAELCGMGYEGSILRDPKGMHKAGRSSPTQGGLLRIKSFSDCEGVVIGIEEGEKNNNPAMVNARGRTERSTHKENMVPSGMAGALFVNLLKDQKVNNGKKVVPAGTVCKVSVGKLTHDERRDWFLNSESKKGLIVKFQHFPKGVKDALRFATFQSVRSPNDL